MHTPFFGLSRPKESSSSAFRDAAELRRAVAGRMEAAAGQSIHAAFYDIHRETRKRILKFSKLAEACHALRVVDRRTGKVLPERGPDAVLLIAGSFGRGLLASFFLIQEPQVAGCVRRPATTSTGASAELIRTGLLTTSCCGLPQQRRQAGLFRIR